MDEPADKLENYGLESYLDGVRNQGGKVEKAEVNGLTIINVSEPALGTGKIRHETYVALRNGRFSAGKRVLYSNSHKWNAIVSKPLQVKYLSLAGDISTIVVLDTEDFRFNEGETAIHFSMYRLSDNFLSGITGHLPCDDLNPYFLNLFTWTTGRTIGDVAYLSGNKNRVLVPSWADIEHDANTLIRVLPQERIAFLHNRATWRRDSLSKLPVSIDGVNYYLDLPKDDNTFTFVKDRGDGLIEKVTGSLAISADMYEALKTGLLSDKVWERDLDIQKLFQYTLSGASNVQRGNSAGPQNKSQE
ncbi:hypothetical protein HYU40_04210 [Candidatus Woesearchaeota archaeon]|nr:hypothetical protein [Candidatus Woesearchaeota archaeon]